MRVLRKVTRKAMLFVAGCTSNHWKFDDLFDAIVLLAAPIAVIPDRVANATTTRTSSPRANAQIIEGATWSSRPVRLTTRSTPGVPTTTCSRCSRPSLAVDA